MWIILIILAVISLLVFWRGPNAVWGGIALGGIVGLIAAIVYAILGKGFHWTKIGKGIVIGVLIGVVAELIWKLSGHKRQK